MMRLFILLCLLVGLVVPCRAGIPPYIPTYWVVGTVDDATQEDGAVISADGRTVVFYKDDETYDLYNAQATIFNNTFMLNAYYVWPLDLTVGDTYEVIVVQGDDGFGAGPFSLTITGYGYEEILGAGTVSLDDFSEFDNPEEIWEELVDIGIIDSDGTILVDDIDAVADTIRDALADLGLTDAEIEEILDILRNAEDVAEGGLFLVEDGGKAEMPESGDATPVEEPNPEFEIWFGNRLYQQALVEKGDIPVVAEKPAIRVEVSIDEPFSLASGIENYSITVDPGTANAKTLGLTTQHITQTVYIAGSEDEAISSYSLQYSMEEDLSEGEHTFEFTAASEGTYGTASSVTSYATIEVMGGPLRIVGTPLAYPSPYSITKHGIVTIQYELSQDANIDIYLIDATGKRLKKLMYDSGTEGGAAGINKVTWNGRADQGYLAGNAIYVGTFIARDEGRLLAKLKLAIVD